MKKKHNSQLKVVEAFKEKGIEIEILNLEVSTKTSQEAADAVNCEIKQIAISIVLLITYIIFLTSPKIFKKLGHSGARLIQKLMGIILMVIAVQFVIDGFSNVIINLIKN